MSFAALKWVSEQIRRGHLKGKAATSSARLVALALADFHNSSTGRCFPSYEGLSKFTGLGRATVARAIKVLEELKVIHCNYRVEYDSGRKGSNLYVFAWPPGYLENFKKAQFSKGDPVHQEERDEERRVNVEFKKARIQEINAKAKKANALEGLMQWAFSDDETAEETIDGESAPVTLLPYDVQAQPVDGITMRLYPSHSETTPVSPRDYPPSHHETLTYNLNLEYNQELNPARASAEGANEVFEIQEDEQAGEPSSKAEENTQAPAAGCLEGKPEASWASLITSIETAPKPVRTRGRKGPVQ